MPVKVVRAMLAACVLMLAVPAEAAWLKAETPHFRLFSNGGERQLRQFALLIEDYDRLLRLLTAAEGPPSPNKLDIYLVGSSASLRTVRPKLPATVLGFYSATPGAIAALSVRRDGWGIEGQEVLFHEYAHHFMMQYFPYGYPGWYVEGFAEYMMTANFSEKTVEFGGINPGRAYTLLSEPWLALSRLIEAGPDSLKERDAAAFYAESWLLVHYLFRTGKTESLNRFLRYRREGQSDAKAFEQAFGSGYVDFERQLRAYMGGRISYSRMTRGSSEAAVPVEITSLPASADDLLLTGLALRLGPEEEAGAALLDRVRKEAARYPGDRLAATVLAEAETAFGDPAAAASLLDPLIGAAPGDTELLYLRGCADLAAGHKNDAARAEHFGKAKRWFARAFRGNPDHYQTLYRYAESLSLEPMSENTLNVLLKAQALAPQVEPIALNAAAGLMRHKRFAEAENLLAPITSNPHSAKLADHARAMLAKAREGQEPDLDYAATKQTAE